MTNPHDILKTSPLYGHSSLKLLWQWFDIPKGFQKRNEANFDDAYQYRFLKKGKRGPRPNKEERLASFVAISREKAPILDEIPAGESKDDYRPILTIKKDFDFLKKAQKRFNKLTNSYISLKSFPYISACIHDTSFISNAKKHEGDKYLLITDIHNFFGTISRDKVRQKLKELLAIDEDTADYYSRLLTSPTYENPNAHCLGQGLPSSPILACICNIEVFDTINALCLTKGYTFTIYVDDLTISSDKPIPQKFINFLVFYFGGNGMKMSRKKIHYFPPIKAKKITGLISVGGKTYVPNRTKEEISILDKEINHRFGALSTLAEYLEAYNLFLRFCGLFQELIEVEVPKAITGKCVWPQQYIKFKHTYDRLRAYFPLGKRKIAKDKPFEIDNVSDETKTCFSAFLCQIIAGRKQNKPK